MSDVAGLEPSAPAAKVAATAEAAARRSYGRLVALLASRSGDVAGAEDALADAFAAALATWPSSGVPASPEAWLLVTARRRRLDRLRHAAAGAAAADHLRLLAAELADGLGEADGTAIPDRRLALMFVCAHPAIEPAIRAPLMLQTVLGLDAATIASAFLVSPAAMAARLGRAKQKIRDAAIPFRLPDATDLPERLDAVLSGIYAAYSDGWSEAGTGAGRNLAAEAVFLGRMTAAMLPDEPEALGLLSLMLHAEARRAARRTGTGGYVPLGDQDPARWDLALAEEADALLLRASRGGPSGRFQIEAAIQSAHAARRHSGRTDWPAILGLYDALLALTCSPVVAINRAVVLAETAGATVGLAALDALESDRRLATYQPYWAARARLSAMAGLPQAAAEAYDRAIGLEQDGAARDFLVARRAELTSALRTIIRSALCRGPARR